MTDPKSRVQQHPARSSTAANSAPSGTLLDRMTARGHPALTGDAPPPAVAKATGGKAGTLFERMVAAGHKGLKHLNRSA